MKIIAFDNDVDPSKSTLYGILEIQKPESINAQIEYVNVFVDWIEKNKLELNEEKDLLQRNIKREAKIESK